MSTSQMINIYLLKNTQHEKYEIVLKAAKVVKIFISCGMEFQVLGPKYDVECLSYVSVSTRSTLNFFPDWCLKL